MKHLLIHVRLPLGFLDMFVLGNQLLNLVILCGFIDQKFNKPAQSHGVICWILRPTQIFVLESSDAFELGCFSNQHFTDCSEASSFCFHQLCCAFSFFSRFCFVFQRLKSDSEKL